MADPTPAQRHRKSAIDRLSQVVELAAQGRAALAEGADPIETAALLESLKHDVKAVLEYLELAGREEAHAAGRDPKFKVGGFVKANASAYGLARGAIYKVTATLPDAIEVERDTGGKTLRVPSPHLYLSTSWL